MFLEGYKMASRIFDDEEVKKIREEYKRGKTLKQLAIKYFCCESTIGNIVRCSGAYAQNTREKGGENGQIREVNNIT